MPIVHYDDYSAEKIRKGGKARIHYYKIKHQKDKTVKISAQKVPSVIREILKNKIHNPKSLPQVPVKTPYKRKALPSVPKKKKYTMAEFAKQHGGIPKKGTEKYKLWLSLKS